MYKAIIAIVMKKIIIVKYRLFGFFLFVFLLMVIHCINFAR